MAIQFYLGNTRVYPEVNATLTERVGTFSDGVLALQFNNIKNAILPMTTLKITDGVSNWNYVVLSDSVEKVSKTSAFYKHNLVVRSAIYEATKHIARNTSFSQPPLSLKGDINFLTCSVGNVQGNDFEYPAVEEGKKSYTHKDIKLNSRSKVSGMKLKIDTTLYSWNLGGNYVKTHNAHSYGIIKLVRYTSGVATRYDIYEIDEHQTELTIRFGSIFDNLTDDEVFALELDNDLSWEFDIDPNYNDRCFARVNVKLELETYYYSLYDICDILYKQSCKTYNNQNSNDFHFLKLANTTKNNELKRIIAPEISFTGVDYYNALYQTFSYIDAIPVVDGNGYLTYEYLNNNNQNAVSINKADEKITLNDQYFTNKLVANYQNGRQDNAITYPKENGKVRTCGKNFGIPSSSSDYILKVQKPIDYLDSVVVETGDLQVVITIWYGSQNHSSSFAISIEEVELVNRVLESSVYGALDNYSDYYHITYEQNNCIAYSRGSDYIDLLGNTGYNQLQKEVYKYAFVSEVKYQYGIPCDTLMPKIQTTHNIIDMYDVDNPNTKMEDRVVAKQEIHYRVKYHALFDGKVEQVSTTSKYEGETYVNQETSSVSLNRMGNNLQGLIAKLGNETENITLGVSSYGSRMKAGSLWVDDDGNRYIANTVRTTFSSSSDKVIVEAEFTKNFNLISQYTKVDQDKRFYEISESLTSKGYDNITEYVYFSYEAPTTYDYDAVSINYLTLKAIVERTLKQDSPTNYQTCDFATFRAYTHESDQNPFSNYFIYLPLHIYGSGNSLCFETDYNETLNAGNRLTGSGTNNDPYFVKTTLYTEGLGFADKVEIKGWHSGSSESYVGDDFPKMTYATTIQTNDSCFGIEYKYFKKPNEIFHLNYALAFMGENFFFGNKFIEQNGIMSNSQYGNALKFYKSNGVYSIIDNTILDDSTEVSITSTDYNYYNTGTNRYYLKITITLATNISCKSWCLADENGNVYLASNKEIANNNEIVIYIIPRRNRI